MGGDRQKGAAFLSKDPKKTQEKQKILVVPILGSSRKDQGEFDFIAALFWHPSLSVEQASFALGPAEWPNPAQGKAGTKDWGLGLCLSSHALVLQGWRKEWIPGIRLF